MSKSLGNVYTISQLKENGVEALAYKLFCYSSHYRNKLNFTWDGAKASQVALNRLRKAYLLHLEGTEEIDDNYLSEIEEKFHKAINDDINMPEAMGIVWDLLKNEKKSIKIANLILKFDEVLGLDIANSKKYLQKDVEIPEEIIALAEKRKEAKINKNFEEADKIRNEIIEKGYNIKDLPKNQFEIILAEE